MTTTKKKATKGVKKVPAPKKKPEPEGRSGPDVVALGEQLGVVLGRAPTDVAVKEISAALTVGKKLTEGTVPTNPQLVKLRDSINAIAAELRAVEQADDARELSQLNRLVRRLERSTR